MPGDLTGDGVLDLGREDCGPLPRGFSRYHGDESLLELCSPDRAEETLRTGSYEARAFIMGQWRKGAGEWYEVRGILHCLVSEYERK